MPAHVVVRIQLSATADDAVMDVVEGNQQEWSILFREYLETQVHRYHQQAPWSAPLSVDWNDLLQEAPLQPADGRWDAFPFVDEERSEWYGEDMRQFVQVFLTPREAQPQQAPVLSSRASATTAGGLDLDTATFDFQIEYSPAVSIQQSCTVLSCLLRYSPETTGSVYHLYALRRLIMPILLDEIQAQSAIAFDRSHLADIMDEWLLVPAPLQSNGSRSPFLHRHPELSSLATYEQSEEGLVEESGEIPLNWDSYCHAGRSAGVMCTGAKGVGKSTFGLEIIAILQRIAPWMITVVYKDMPLRSEIPDGTIPANIKRCEFFEGGNFKCDVRAMMLMHPEVKVSTMAAFFRIMQQSSQAGKLTVTFIDDIDVVILGKGSSMLLNQFAFEVNNANFEFFLFTTSSTSAVPSFANVDISKNFHQIGLLRTMKVFDAPLRAAYDLVLRDIRNPPAICGSEAVMTALKTAAEVAYELQNAGDVEYMKRRRRLELFLHNMKTVDLKKLALQTCLYVKSALEACPDAHITFQSALEHVLNKKDVLTGMNPEVGATTEWVRHAMNFSNPAHLEKLADVIYRRATNHKQFVFFVQLESNPEAFDAEKEKALYREYEEENDHKRSYRIHHHSAPAFMHQLHKRFAFRASFNLRSAPQLLPHNILHSAFLPYSSANPFNEFYWHHRNSCIIIDDLDTVVGYHEMQKQGKGKMAGQGKSDIVMLDRTRVIGRKFIAEAGLQSLAQRANTNATSTSDAMTVAKDQGGSVNAKIALLPGIGGGLEKLWGQSRAVGRDVENVLASTFGLGPIAYAGVGASLEEYCGQLFRDERFKREASSDNLDVAHTFNHPEALVKIICGLRAIRENAVRDVEDLRNVVVIFYKSFECFRELTGERLRWHDNGSYDPPAVGCAHYQRNIKVFASCCKQWVSCEHCHNEQYPDHSMTRESVDIIQCHSCFARQTVRADGKAPDLFPYSVPVSNGRDCVSCGHRFANNICIPCRLWCDEFHCHEEEEDVFSGTQHCDNCDRCYPARYIDFHRELCVSTAAPAATVK